MSDAKKILRKAIINQRQQLAPDIQQQASQTICSNLSALPAIAAAKTIALYHGTHGEANPFPLVKQVSDKIWLMPVINPKNQLDFVVFDKHSKMIKNRYDIHEPENRENSIPPQQIDVILMPLVAFDHYGNRIGRGAGHYDRALSFMQHSNCKKPWLIGIAYAFQQTENIATDQWDIPLNTIVTEKTIHQIQEPA